MRNAIIFVSMLVFFAGSGELLAQTATPTPAPPETPTNLKRECGDGRVRLEWDDMGVDYYLFQRAKLPGGYDSGGVTITSNYHWDVTDGSWLVTNGSTYSYQVQSGNGVVMSPFSAPVTALPAAPPRITNPAVRVEQEVGHNILRFNPAAKVDGGFEPSEYAVYRSENGGATFQKRGTAHLAGGERVYRDSIDPGVSYYYMVKVTDDAADDAVTLICEHVSQYDVVFVEALDFRLALDANSFNPLRGEFVTAKCSLLRPAHLLLRVFTLSGRQVYEFVDDKNRGSGDWDDWKWDGRNQQEKTVASGVYVFVMEVKGEGFYYRFTRKVAVIK